MAGENFYEGFENDLEEAFNTLGNPDSGVRSFYLDFAAAAQTARITEAPNAPNPAIYVPLFNDALSKLRTSSQATDFPTVLTQAALLLENERTVQKERYGKYGGINQSAYLQTLGSIAAFCKTNPHAFDVGKTY